MTLRRDVAQAKLNAIRAKDVDAIVARQPIIFGLASPYTRQQLLAWARPKIDLLQGLLDAPDAAARLALLTPIYQSLSDAGKLTVQGILAGTVDVDALPTDDPEILKFILACLVHFADPDLRVP